MRGAPPNWVIESHVISANVNMVTKSTMVANVNKGTVEIKVNMEPQ
jgi:hypothetical protein